MTLIDVTHDTSQTTRAASYVPPRLDLIAFPRTVNTVDGFEVSGRAVGSEIEGTQVEVSVAGVTRTGRVHRGIWFVRFEDWALAKGHLGVRPVTARMTDRWFNAVQATAWTVVDEFVDGFVHVDERYDIVGHGTTEGHVAVSGELGLGTHDQGRELVVVLVRDDPEGVVVATGLVDDGWWHGEWFARIPLVGVPAGSYRVRALLTDGADASLTRLGWAGPFALG